MSRKQYLKIAGLASLTILINALVLFTGWTAARYLGALLLLFVLPGWTWAELLLPPIAGRLEQATIAIGLSFALSGLASLAVHYWPGPVTTRALLLASDVLIIVPLVAMARREEPRFLGGTRVTSPFTQNRLWLIALLVATLFFRLANLGYSEFQGDEALVLLSAAEAIDGREVALFTHGKAPAEVLFPTSLWPLAGAINEPMVRFPFALVGTVGVLAVYLLGRRMFNERVGLAAGVLLAINGFTVGFGRIVQYQSLVFGMTALALYCTYRWYADHEPWYQVPGALFLAFGLLSHLDAVLALPAVGVLYLARLWPSGGKDQRTTDQALQAAVGGPQSPDTRSLLLGSVPTFALSLALFVATLALFYVPFARDPQFGRTFGYLASSRVGNQMLTNTLGSFFTLSTVYNSSYYFVCLFLLLAFLVVRELSRLAPWRWLAPGLFAAASLSVLLAPHLWQWGRLNASVVPFVLTLLALYASRHTPVELKTTLTWLAAPFFVYAFVVEYPLTHVYNVYPPLCLLAGVAIDRLVLAAGNKRQQALHILLPAACYLFLAVFSYYVYFMFVSHSPEYRRTYPAHRHPWYWTAYDELPAEGYFGFPYRAGWKVVGQLYAKGVLQGDYGSNEEAEITTWYTRRAARSCYPDPDYYFIAENVQDVQPVPQDVLNTYTLTGQVLVDDEPKLSIYQRQSATASPATYRVPTYATAFDRAARPAFFADRVAISHPLDVNLGNRVRLLGYDLDAGNAKQETGIRLTLYWQATTPMDTSYHVFVHLETDRIWGQADGIPVCNLYPTNLWRVGQVIPDRYRVPVDPATPPGDYGLLVGLYEPDTGQRLEVIDPAGDPQGNSVQLATVYIGQ